MTKEEQKSFSVKLVTTKAPAGDEKTFTAVVTAPSEDRDYDIIDAASIRLHQKGTTDTITAKSLTGGENLDVPLFIDHSSSMRDMVGSARSARMNATGELEMTFGLADTELAQTMYKLLSGNHLGNNVSIGFTNYSNVDGVLYGAELLEVSLVWKGSNKDARILGVSKMFGIEEKQTEEPVEKEETTEETETNTTEEVEVAKAEDEETVKTETEVEVDDTTEEESDKEINKEIKNMTKEELAAETVVETKEVVVEQPKKKAAVSNNMIRVNFAKQVAALRYQKPEMLAKFVKEGAEMVGADTKALDLSDVYLTEVVANDIKSAYVDAGGVGSLVNRLDITGATQYKGFYETNGVGFQAVSLGGEKQEDAPVWLPVTITPYEYALIVAWQDDAADQTPLAVYQNVVRYIANQYKRLEDKVILTQAAQTVDGENRAATGLAPLLEAAHRSSAISTNLTAQYLVPALATAFGNIKSDGQLTIVANRKTWGQMATSQDANYNTVFQVVGKQVMVGALGMMNVVTSEALSDNEIVVGVFSDYTLVTRGGVSTLFSQEATVGELNLFTMDASALRAKVNIAGKAVPLTSFWLLTGAGFVS